MASKKYIEFEETLENAVTDALDCADKLRIAAQILKSMGERPINQKKFEKFLLIADALAEDLGQLAEEVTDERMEMEELESEED